LKEIFYCRFQIKDFDLLMAELGGKLIRISFACCEQNEFFTWLDLNFPGISKHQQSPENNKVFQETQRQLSEYFNGKRREFDLLIKLEGTVFQGKVWNELARIPWGETRTYGQVAKMAGNPKASRAAGGACNKNPIPIVIPCHRVLGEDGSLVGFSGGLEFKKKLLEIEGIITL
jgi:methylated-DNA-[protein]-cysteine S-methyltransferase